MKKIILVDSQFPINTRNMRLLNTLKKKYNVSYIAWNRDESSVIQDKRNFIFEYNCEYGNKFKKFISIKSYKKFIEKVIEKEKPDIVIASHWDMLFIMAVLRKKFSFKLIYDNLDMPTGNKFLLKFIKLLEKKAIQKTQGIILASRFFSEKYNHENTIIFENYIDNSIFGYENKIARVNSEKNASYKIAFIGVVRHYKILKNLIDAFANNYKYEIFIIGDGMERKSLSKYVEDKDIKNVYFSGRYKYEEIPQIYNKYDLIWAAYPNKDYNSKYAISNKFFEIINYEKRCVFSEKTSLGDFVVKNNIGYKVNPYCKKDIKDTINRIKKEYNKNLEFQKFKSENYIEWEKNEQRLIEFFENIK